MPNRTMTWIIAGLALASAFLQTVVLNIGTEGSRSAIFAPVQICHVALVIAATFQYARREDRSWKGCLNTPYFFLLASFYALMAVHAIWNLRGVFVLGTVAFATLSFLAFSPVFRSTDSAGKRSFEPTSVETCRKYRFSVLAWILSTLTYGVLTAFDAAPAMFANGWITHPLALMSIVAATYASRFLDMVRPAESRKTYPNGWTFYILAPLSNAALMAMVLAAGHPQNAIVALSAAFGFLFYYSRSRLA